MDFSYSARLHADCINQYNFFPVISCDYDLIPGGNFDVNPRGGGRG